MAHAYNELISEHASKFLGVGSRIKQVEDLSKEDLEILFERNFTDMDAMILKESVRTYSITDFFKNTHDLAEAVTNVVKSEYYSASFGPARSLRRAATATAISRKIGIPKAYVDQAMRAEDVIHEVESIEPTLQGVVDGIRDGNEEVLRVWNN